MVNFNNLLNDLANMLDLNEKDLQKLNSESAALSVEELKNEIQALKSADPLTKKMLEGILSINFDEFVNTIEAYVNNIEDNKPMPISEDKDEHKQETNVKPASIIRKEQEANVYRNIEKYAKEHNSIVKPENKKVDKINIPDFIVPTNKPQEKINDKDACERCYSKNCEYCYKGKETNEPTKRPSEFISEEDKAALRKVVNNYMNEYIVPYATKFSEAELKNVHGGLFEFACWAIKNA